MQFEDDTDAELLKMLQQWISAAERREKAEVSRSACQVPEWIAGRASVNFPESHQT